MKSNIQLSPGPRASFAARAPFAATLAALALTLAALAACSDDAPATPPPLDATLGGFQIHVEARPPRLSIRDASGRVLIDSVDGGLQVGHADGAYEHQFGAFKIEESNRELVAATLLADLRLEADEVRFDLVGAGGAVLGTGAIAAPALPAAVGAAPELTITLTAKGITEGDPRVSFAYDCAADERFIGFGGQTFKVDQRGERVPIWVQEDGIGKDDLADDDYGGIWFLSGRRHSTHTPMPIYLSNGGYAAWLEGSRYALFDLCAEDPGAVRVETWAETLRLHVFAVATPRDGVRALTARLGRPALPPPFAFAPWLDALYGSANVRRVAAKLRAEGVPSSVIWTEDWRGGNFEGGSYVLEEDWELDRDLYPDFEAVASDLHDLGFKFLTYNNSFLDSDVPTFTEAAAGGHTIRDPATGQPYLFNGVKFRPSSLLDLSSPDAVAWATQKYRDGLELGADGYMADFAEWLPTDAVLASGESGEAAHNLYPIEWQRLHKNLFDAMHAEDGVDRLFFVRSAFVGSQPLVSVVWGGDQQTDFSVGDGYPSVIPIGLGLGLTGFPYYGHDVGGYTSQGVPPATEELWYRWVTLGALSPVMRTHHGRAVNENWQWEKDAAATAHFARWATLHIRLFPYLYAMARDGATLGDPMFRSLALEYPDFAPGWTTTDEFLLGDRILVAPVVTQGATTRAVQLPPGRWFPLLGGAGVTSDGASDVQAAATITEIPAFVPAGALLVLLPEGVQTLAPAAPASGVVGLADAADDRELWLWPGGTSALTEASGALSYTWDAAGLTGPIASATWNGAAVPLGETLALVGPGTLVLNGGEATLVVSGGAADRALLVRMLGLSP